MNPEEEVSELLYQKKYKDLDELEKEFVDIYISQNYA